MSEPIPFRKRLAQNTAASILTNVWTIVLTVGSLPVILHGLGTKAFGVWAFLQAFNSTTGWLSVPATGLAISSTRAVASAEPAARARAAGATFAVFIAAGAAFGCLLALLVPVILESALDLRDVETGSLAVVGIAFGVQVLAEHVALAAASVLEGAQAVATARVLESARKTAVVVAVAIAATADVGLSGVVVVSATATVAASIAMFGLAAQRRWLELSRPIAGEARTVWSYAVTVSALTGTGVLHRTMDRMIAGVIFGPSAVALVEVANQLQAGSSALLSASTYPVLSSTPWLQNRDDPGALASLFKRSTRYSLLITLPVAALTIALAAPFIDAWLGAEFSEAVGLTQVAVVFVMVAAPLQAGSNLLQGAGRARDVLRAAAVSVVVNLVASIVLANTIGLVGVFVGTILGGVTLIPLLLRPLAQLMGHQGISIAQAVLAAGPPAIAAGGAGAAIAHLNAPDWLRALGGGATGIVAAAAVAFAWSIGAEERQEIVRALGRRQVTAA